MIFPDFRVFDYIIHIKQPTAKFKYQERPFPIKIDKKIPTFWPVFLAQYSNIQRVLLIFEVKFLKTMANNQKYQKGNMLNHICSENIASRVRVPVRFYMFPF